MHLLKRPHYILTDEGSATPFLLKELSALDVSSLGGGDLISHIGRSPSLDFSQNMGKCNISSVYKITNNF